MNQTTLKRLTEIRESLEADLTRLDEIESREATRERMRAIAARTRGEEEKPKPRVRVKKTKVLGRGQQSKERMQYRAAKKKLGPGEKMVFGKVVKAGA